MFYDVTLHCFFSISILSQQFDSLLKSCPHWERHTNFKICMTKQGQVQIPHHYQQIVEKRKILIKILKWNYCLLEKAWLSEKNKMLYMKIFLLKHIFKKITPFCHRTWWSRIHIFSWTKIKYQSFLCSSKIEIILEYSSFQKKRGGGKRPGILLFIFKYIFKDSPFDTCKTLPCVQLYFLISCIECWPESLK